MKKRVTNKEIEQWYDEAGRVTLKNLNKFLDKILNDYEHDHDTVCYAAVAGITATLWAMDSGLQGGIIEHESIAITEELLRYWWYPHNKCGLEIIDFDKMIYPQYRDRYEKTISKYIWDKIQREASNKIKQAEDGEIDPDNYVVQHWVDIVNNKVPFGYRVIED